MRAKKSQQNRGRDAERPSEIPARGWKDIAWRVWDEVREDRIMLVAAGATFYLLLALFPFLAAFVSLYGFFADPATITNQVSFLSTVLPTSGVEIIENQLRSLAAQDRQTLGFGFFASLAVALWSSNNGVKALFDGLNVVYDEEEKRGFIKLNLASFAFTLGAIVLGIIFLLAVGVVPAVLAFLQLESLTSVLISLGRWPLLLLLIAAALALLYRFGPSREQAKFRWLTWGAGLAAVAWILMSWGFSYYLQNFANYNATYGSLGAVIGLMVWIWLSVAIVLVGGEFNAETEHQTARDSTTGPPRPMGKRGGTMADTLGEPADAR